MTIRALTLLVRHSDLSREDFDLYWREKHATVARRIPGLRSYVQHHLITSVERTGVPSGPPSVDGISDLNFDSLGDLEAALSSSEADDAARDALNFVSEMRMYVFEDHVVIAERDHTDGAIA